MLSRQDHGIHEKDEKGRDKSVTPSRPTSFIRSVTQRLAAEARDLGQEQVRLLGVVTGGHIAIHWFQQLFTVAQPFIKAGLGLSGVQYGALAAARQFGQGTLNLPCGMLGDALYRHRDAILASSLVTMGVAYLLFGSRGGFWVAFSASVLIGFGTALWHPTAAATLTSKFPQRRATAIAVHGTGATVSDSLSPLAQGVLIAVLPWEGFLWWHIVPGVLFGFLVLRGLLGAFRQDTRLPSRTTRFREMMALLGNGSFMAITASRGLLTMGRVVILAFLPIYLVEELHFTPPALGVYIFLLHVVGIFSQTPLGYLSDRYGRKPVLVPSMLVLGVLYLLLAVAPPVVALTLVIIAIGTFFYTLMNVMTAVISDVSGANVQASSQGLTTVIAQVAVLPTPIIAGFLADHYGSGSVFILAGVFVMLSAACLMPLKLYAGDRDES